MKVFNSSVENRVEKARAWFKNMRCIYVSSCLHKFRCRCVTSKQYYSRVG